MHNTIRSTDYAAIVADSFEILVDDNKERRPVIGLKIDPRDRPAFIVPMTYQAAKDIALNIGKVLMFVAPEVLGI
ncbi:hypothetical protein [Mycobacterium intracellulare]|uniref:hypothetical protein n=1 Tax=Mycobacterium intracellulare TaxID=1767 RepID=UPI000BAAEBBC|nr:hypothetical protein [Mycobacterium intracellulare]ASW84798.1 hypothetical protein CKJ61_07745 [Mycobacterium intracellulare]